MRLTEKVVQKALCSHFYSHIDQNFHEAWQNQNYSNDERPSTCVEHKAVFQTTLTVTITRLNGDRKPVCIMLRRAIQLSLDKGIYIYSYIIKRVRDLSISYFFSAIGLRQLVLANFWILNYSFLIAILYLGRYRFSYRWRSEKTRHST